MANFLSFQRYMHHCAEEKKKLQGDKEIAKCQNHWGNEVKICLAFLDALTVEKMVYSLLFISS